MSRSLLARCYLSLLVVAMTVSGSITAGRGGNQKKGANPCTPAYTGPEVTNPFSNLFCEAPELRKFPLKVTAGSIPDWLLGTLYRNVPAKFNFGSDQVQHLFDAMGQLQGFHFENATSAFVEAKFMQTESYVTMNAEKAFSWIGAYTEPFPGPLFPIKNTTQKKKQQQQKNEAKGDKYPKKLHDDYVINNDVSLLFLGGRYFGTTDSPALVEWNGTTLETLTPNLFHWNDTIVSQTAPTHGQMDEHTHEYFNIVGDVPGMYATTTFWKVNSTALSRREFPHAWGRTPIATVKTTNLTYSHSIGLTRKNVLFMENPLNWDVIALILKAPPIRTLITDKTKTVPMKMHAVDRITGEHKVATVKGPGIGCMLHNGNGFEDEAAGTITWDSVQFPGCNAYDSMTMDNLLSNVNHSSDILKKAYLVRCVMNVGAGATGADGDQGEAACHKIIEEGTQEFPWYNKQFHMRPYRYAYTITAWGTPPQDVSTGIIRKVDVVQGKTVLNYTKPGHVFTEALFVPKNKTLCTHGEDTGACHPSAEDEGALLSVVYNAVTDRSQILALDAKDFSTIFVIELPFTVPFHFHGIFCEPMGASSKADRFCLWN